MLHNLMGLQSSSSLQKSQATSNQYYCTHQITIKSDSEDNCIMDCDEYDNFEEIGSVQDLSCIHFQLLLNWSIW